MLGHATNGVNVALDIGGNALAVSTHPTRSIDKVVGPTDATEALRHLLALGADARQFLVRCLCLLLELLKACGWFWRTPRTALLRRAHSVGNWLWHLFKARLGLTGRFCRSALLGGHGPADGFDQFMLHME